MASVYSNQKFNLPALSTNSDGGGSDHPENGHSAAGAEKSTPAKPPEVVESLTQPSGEVAMPPKSAQTESVGPLSSATGKEIAHVFKLLADETRLKILMYLMQEKELNVRSLCERLSQSQPAVSHHLALMRQAGLVMSRRQGKNNFYRFVPHRLAEIRDLLDDLFLKGSDYRAAM